MGEATRERPPRGSGWALVVKDSWEHYTRVLDWEKLVADGSSFLRRNFTMQLIGLRRSLPRVHFKTLHWPNESKVVSRVLKQPLAHE